MRPASLARDLLSWYESAKRDLPWRKTSDPWAIWVSEVMLQQTRVEAVRDPYARFLARYPDCKSFARVDDDELLTAWQGLGYYRRARLLREAARRVTAEHDGVVPGDREAFAALPGVGSYTEGAVLSIAFGQALPAIDGNVERVVARLLAIDTDPKRKPASKRIREFVTALHGDNDPGQLNQALMELGATVCVPRTPSCLLCPWRRSCEARRTGRVDALPVQRPREAIQDIVTAVCFVERGGNVLARRVPDGEINGGQLCLPGLGLPVPTADDLSAVLVDSHGLRGRITPRLATIRHAITRYRIRVEVFGIDPAPPHRRPGRGLCYRDPADTSLPWSTVARKVMRAVRRADTQLR